jgi:hypothetical protein
MMKNSTQDEDKQHSHKTTDRAIHQDINLMTLYPVDFHCHRIKLNSTQYLILGKPAISVVPKNVV